MERWASNTLRILGIVAASLALLCASLLMLILITCGVFKNPPDQGKAFGFVIAYIAILVGCVFAIIKLGKGIAHSGSAPPPPLPGMPAVDVPLHPLADSSLQLFNYLRLTIVAEIFLGFASWVINASQHSPEPGSVPGLWIGLLISALISQIPYIVLLILLRNPPKRPVMAFAVALPFVSILSSLYYILIFGRYYVRAPQAIATMLLFIALDAAIVVLAWRLRSRLRYNYENGSLAVAAVVCLVYIGFSHALSPWLYQMGLWRFYGR